jgi:hypothetical protein
MRNIKKILANLSMINIILLSAVNLTFYICYGESIIERYGILSIESISTIAAYGFGFILYVLVFIENLETPFVYKRIVKRGIIRKRIIIRAFIYRTIKKKRRYGNKKQ